MASCEKVCRNKAGLVMYEKRMHMVNGERGRFVRDVGCVLKRRGRG